MKSLLPLTVANIRSFVRDRTAMFWTFAFPVIFILLFGAIFSGGGSAKYTVGWVDEDGSKASDALRAVFGHVSLFDLKDATLVEARDAVSKGNDRAVIVIPKGFGAAMAGACTAGRGLPTATGITVYTDESQQTSSLTIQQVVSQVVSCGVLGLGPSVPVLTQQHQPLQALTNIDTNNLTDAAWLVPGILGMALMQGGIFAAVPLVEQREKLILKRLAATPLRRWTLVGSNVVLRLIIAIAQAVILIGIGVAVFGVQVLGSLALMAFLVALGAVTFIAIGYVVAAFARTEEAANGIVQVVQFPMMFLSGVFFPIEIMPNVLRPVATIMPLTYLGDALRQVMINGSPYAPLPVDIAVLGGWMLVCLVISARFFRWE